MTESSEEVFDGIGVPPGKYTAKGTSRARYGATFGLLALGLGFAMTVLHFWDRAVTDAATYACPPDCGRPPNAVPVASLPRFVAPGGAFSVNYPAPNAAYQVTTRDDGVTAKLTRTGQPEASVPLARREARDCLAEDMRRLDADEIYQAALQGIDKVKYV